MLLKGNIYIYRTICCEFNKNNLPLQNAFSKYLNQKKGKIETLFQSAFFAPSSKGRQGWDIIAVDNKADIEKLSEAKEHYISFIANAPLVVVLCGDKSVNDCWIEDASIVGVSMQYQAEELSLGSCWIQIRDRYLSDNTSCEEIVRGILDIPANQQVLALIAFGYPNKTNAPHNADKIKWEKVHIGKW